MADASISPFSSVTLTKLKVQAAGQVPIVEADQVVARYSLMDIIKGNIHVDEVTLRVEPAVLDERRRVAGLGLGDLLRER